MDYESTEENMKILERLSLLVEFYNAGVLLPETYCGLVQELA